MSHSDALKLLFPPIGLEGVFDNDIALEGARLDDAQASAETLLDEMFADTATALLASWERVCGITPGADDTVLARQNRVVQQLRARGGLSKAYFVGLAAALGFAITIDEFIPFMAGIGRSGDTLYVPEVVFVWRVNVSGYAVYQFRAGTSRAGDLLLWWPVQTMIEGIFNLLKPAHTYVFF